jgi:hypothetical protein
MFSVRRVVVCTPADAGGVDGVGAAVIITRDLYIALGFFSLLNKEIVVTVLLTSPAKT